MKAVKWAERLRSEDVGAVYADFIVETNNLVAERTKKSSGEAFIKSATDGALREARQKWGSACRQAGHPEFEGFALTGLPKEGNIPTEVENALVV